MSREEITTIRVIDNAQLETAARAQVMNVYGLTEEQVRGVYCAPIALITQHGINGDLHAVVGTEGVGMYATEHSQLVEVFCGVGAMMDCYPVRFRVQVLLEMVSEEVLLADWVRTFGSRLESNFYQWSRWANKQTGGEPIPR